MLGFDLDIWDYLTFLVMFVLIGAFLTIAVLVLGLPGRIAIARKHPDADAINTMGWLGFLAVVPWMQAFMWAFKPTDVVDIRYFPRQEQQNIGEELARLKGKPIPEKNSRIRAEIRRVSGIDPLGADLMMFAFLITFLFGLVVWLVFFKFKWLKFTKAWAVIVLFFVAHLFLTFIVGLRFITPYSTNLKVVQHTIQLVPRLPEPTLVTAVLVAARCSGEEGSATVPVRPSAV